MGDCARLIFCPHEGSLPEDVTGQTFGGLRNR